MDNHESSSILTILIYQNDVEIYLAYHPEIVERTVTAALAEHAFASQVGTSQSLMQVDSTKN
jgi:hypothetical protein